MKRATTRNARRKKKGTEVSAIQIIEEAFQLLRSAPGGTLVLYFFGTVPFVCLLFYFWADMSRSSYAQRDSGLASLGMAIAFFWKCSWQARFCRSLWERISPGYIPKQTGWQRVRYHAAIWIYQAFSIPLVFLAICFVIPLAWVTTAFQNGYVLGLTQDYGRQPLRKLTSHAFRNSHYQWAQNHGIWITMCFIGFLTWVNVFGACSLPPLIGKTFFGYESVFTMNPAALFNSTFLFGTFLVTYLIMSPLLKAIFVLRCFYADSRTSGADLLSRLAELRQNRQSNREAQKSATTSVSKRAASIILGVGILFSTTSSAEETGAPVNTAAKSGSSALDVAIEDTMASRKYQWKFTRKVEAQKVDDEIGWLQAQLKNLADAVEARALVFRTWMKDKLEALFKKLKFKDRKKTTPAKMPKIGAGIVGVIESIGWGVLSVIVTGLIGWLVVVLIKYYREREKEESADGDVIGDIDLESEDIVADQLRGDEWMKLAREQIEKGESRLAIRALFLATLANLGERGLLKIQKHKSNRDYRKELELKARQKTTLRDAFSENTGLFERAWYGLHQIGEESVDHFMKNYETITGDHA